MFRAVLRGSRVPLSWTLLSTGLLAQQPGRQTAHAGALHEASAPQQTGPVAGLAMSATLPNGRHITPAGAWVETAPYPFDLSVRPDGKQVVLPSVGWPFALNVLDVDTGRRRVFRLSSRRQIPAAQKNDAAVEVINGLAYSPDGRSLYVSTGDSGEVDVYDTTSWHKLRRLVLDGSIGGVHFGQSFSGALILSADGSRLYTLDQANWRVVVFDTSTGKAVASVSTGAAPFALALSADGKRLHVANSGLFEYKAVPGVDTKNLLATGLHFPPTGYPSRTAREGTKAEGHEIPGLGNENDVRGSSLWTYSLGGNAELELTTKLRLGMEIQENDAGHAGQVVGGAAPMGVVAGADAVYVSLAHQDAVVVVTTDGSRQSGEIALTPFAAHTLRDARGAALRGIMPAGMATCHGRLYVAEAGIDAVAVVDPAQRRVLGHLPVGWFPSAVACAHDGKALYVVNTKGRGAGPNGGAAFRALATGSYIGEREFGSLSVLPIEGAASLRDGTAQVIENNMADVSQAKPLPRLAHVFLVIRENRTFDEIFGDLPGADGDTELARWGMHGWLKKSPHDRTLSVTPNAHALAARFATSDRFFVDSDVSADGHRWMVGAAETPWFHLAWTSNYGGRRSSDPTSKAPGRRTLGGGSDAPMPEDEPQFGTLWEHVTNAGMTIRNYGEGLEVEGSEEIDGAEPEGQRLVLNSPVPQPVFQSSDRAYPTFNLGIPDQYRYEEFARDFGKLVREGTVPSLIVIRLPNDHTAKPRAGDGYPDISSYVADNDLALGKIVDLVSHTALWKDSAIFVAEDDAQGGVDHVDAHRSVMLAISPWIKPGTLSHRHISMGSLQKTAYELLGVGPLNLEDALAGDMSDMFAATPDLRPYAALPADPRTFDPSRARLARPKSKEQARELLDMDDPEEMAAAARTKVAPAGVRRTKTKSRRRVRWLPYAPSPTCVFG